MPVVINEFEVVEAPAAQRAQPTPTAASAGAAKPEDTELLLAERRARETRVRAY